MGLALFGLCPAIVCQISPPITSPVPEISLAGPIVVGKSIRIKRGSYLIPDQTGKGVILVSADNIEVDFQGATLTGVAGISRTGIRSGIERENFEGIGIAVNGHRNVRIKNANVFGYKWNVMLLNAKYCSVRDCDFSWSKAERIQKDGKSVGSFLNLRDPQAWRDYGAGIWIEGCTACKLTKITARHAQNGVILMKSDSNDVRENDFSYNSGWGIGLQGSSMNVLAWNLADFVNRPWGDGWGGDSASIALANGCQKNSIVGNSMTHSGDGFFLSDRYNGRWDPAKREFIGSCNDNLVALNDGSYSPNNAFEATFSARNFFYRNLATQSNYGFWMGYSGLSMLAWNLISDCHSDGIAWEQGQGNWIVGNTVARVGNVAVHCWSSPGEVSKTYPSGELMISGNTITVAKLALSLENSINVCLKDNLIDNAELPEGLRPTAREQDLRRPVPATFPVLTRISNAKPKGFKMYLETAGARGFGSLKTDDYGPVSAGK